VLFASAVATKRLRAGVSEFTSVRQLLANGNTDEALAKVQQPPVSQISLKRRPPRPLPFYYSEITYDSGSLNS